MKAVVCRQPCLNDIPLQNFAVVRTGNRNLLRHWDTFTSKKKGPKIKSAVKTHNTVTYIECTELSSVEN